MPLAYPTGLPTVLASKRTSKIAPFSMAQPRRGTPYVERTGTDTPTIFDVEWLLQEHEAVVLRDWVYVTLQGGVMPFSIPLRTEDGVRFVTGNFMPDGLLDRQRFGTLWRYRATIVARDGFGSATPPPASDPFFSQVLLLLAGDNNLGTETYLDSGPAARTITRGGSSQILNTGTNPRFGAGALRGVRTGNPFLQFTVPAGSGPLEQWTLDLWISRTDADNSQYLGVLRHPNLALWVNNGSAADNFRPAMTVDGVLRARMVSSVPLNSYVHLAFSVAREGANSVARLFFNGVLEDTYTVAGNGGNMRLNTSPGSGFQIGLANSSGFGGFAADIDMWRLTGGVARYTANFTPPAFAENYLPS